MAMKEAHAMAADGGDTTDLGHADGTPGEARDMSVLIFGCGFSGRAIGERLALAGARVRGTTRSVDKSEALRVRGIDPIVFDGERASDEVNAALAATTHVIVSIAPGRAGDPALSMHGEAIKAAPSLEWIGYLSTVGVYGDHDGAWVDENTVPRPASQRSRERVEAENLWMTLALERASPICVMRLSGIYGPGRSPLDSVREGRARRLVKPGQVFNRIHVDDIAGASELVARSRSNAILNVTDDEPAPPQDVVAYAADLLGVDAPPEQDFETAELTPMARSFYGETKRVSNARLRSMGYALRYPTYREGLRAIRDASSSSG